MGSTFSDSHSQEMGVPKGSILSVTLFSVKINSITQCLKDGGDCSLYVGDFQICYRSSNMSIIEYQLQLCLNKLHCSKLQQWATDKDCLYAYLPEKRSPFRYTVFSGQKSNSCNGGDTFLEVIFDRRLSLIPHFKYVKIKRRL